MIQGFVGRKDGEIGAVIRLGGRAGVQHGVPGQQAEGLAQGAPPHGVFPAVHLELRGAGLHLRQAATGHGTRLAGLALIERGEFAQTDQKNARHVGGEGFGPLAFLAGELLALGGHQDFGSGGGGQAAVAEHAHDQDVRRGGVTGTQSSEHAPSFAHFAHFGRGGALGYLEPR